MCCPGGMNSRNISFFRVKLIKKSALKKLYNKIKSQNKNDTITLEKRMGRVD